MLKSILFALVMLFTGFTTISAQTPQKRFEEANNLFNQSKFTEAARTYQQLIDEGYHQTSLYFNAGNAWYKAGKTGMAVYNYEKALQQSPNNQSVKHNLNIANQKVDGFVGELPLVFFQQWWQNLRLLHTPNGWATGVIIFFWLFIAGVALTRFLPGRSRKYIAIANYVTAVLTLLYLSVAISTYLSANDHSTGVIMAQHKVKSAPDETSRDIFEVGEGVKVHVTDATNEYCKIELADGKSGWISCAAIKRL
ncbi:tetratricopeptide (TPR) repeat protein [Chitinophaga terrae (ex Kim and Jung 2007)]|uniref:tetratricopeptide repeat protein n=1 Tax=Chitinophaga terrae (ex Kim and Jung 2007) TaxID=408074 RepID=UPI002787AD3F|nr:tetratricopeptide repeat protein [Chitinophaga terrae (ex Kim and Jung 2007)]MDQ0105381.1 tetratricopeptide (TPR) repeat protein [Chitinophaga terrae (ex Kim and Jung 2007)]